MTIDELEYRLALIEESYNLRGVKRNDLSIRTRIWVPETSSHALISQLNGVTYITFMGTETWENVEQDLELLSVKTFWGLSTKGFMENYQGLAEKLKCELPTINTDKMVVLGHSLGAIVATLFADDWTTKGNKIQELFLLGLPAGTSRKNINGLRDVIPTIRSFINGNDPIRFVVPLMARFKSLRIGDRNWWPFIVENHFLEDKGQHRGYFSGLREWHKVTFS
jgi:pimeloyl-ACP methyl ester carboxylesterase